MNKCIRNLNYSKYTLDKNLKICEVDDMFEEITGYTKVDIKNMVISQSDLLPEEDRRDYFKIVYNILGKNGEAYLEHRLLKKDGTISYVYCFGTLDSKDKSTIRIMSLDDSLDKQSVKKDYNRRISDLKNEAKSDNLTGLLRREPYINSINYYLSKRQNISFLIIDIDNFKGINDNYGHQFGDKVLIEISNIFNEVAGNDALICRLGGDEFSITLLNVKNEKASLKIVEKIIKKVQSLKLNYEDKVVTNTVSIGVMNLINYKDRYKFNDLYTLADKALYESKSKGKNCYTVNK